MSKVQKIIFLYLAPTVFIVGFVVIHFFVETLSLSEITGRPTSPQDRILVSMFDFDTGATRYEIFVLKRKIPEWEKRNSEISKIKDKQKKQYELENLQAEMLENPIIRNNVERTLTFTTDAVLSILGMFK